MSMRDWILGRLNQDLSPVHVELKDDSGGHSVPDGSESHWNAIIVAPAFEGKSLIDRHRLVNTALSVELLSGRLHALTMKTFSPDEWIARGGTVENVPPKCLGGSKHDAKQSGGGQ